MSVTSAVLAVLLVLSFFTRSPARRTSTTRTPGC